MIQRRFVLLAAALFVVVGAASAVVVGHVRRRAEHPPLPVRPATAAGDSTCLSCHRDKAGYEGTAHRRTSSHPSRASIGGEFTRPRSVLRTPNPAVHFRMSADAAGTIRRR